MKFQRPSSITASQAAALADAAGAVLSVALPPDYRQGVIVHLESLLAMGNQVMHFALPEETKAAPVFRP